MNAWSTGCDQPEGQAGVQPRDDRNASELCGGRDGDEADIAATFAGACARRTERLGPHSEDGSASTVGDFHDRCGDVADVTSSDQGSNTSSDRVADEAGGEDGIGTVPFFITSNAQICDAAARCALSFFQEQLDNESRLDSFSSPPVRRSDARVESDQEKVNLFIIVGWKKWRTSDIFQSMLFCFFLIIYVV